jgi:hypothetical protein
MKKFLVLFLALIAMSGYSQYKEQPSPIKRNTVYFEFFGQGLYDSFTFDRLLHTERKIRHSFSLGLTIVPSPELMVWALPVSYNFIFGQKNHHLELGFGFTPMYIKLNKIQASEAFYDNPSGIQTTVDYIGYRREFYSFFTPKIGYRFQKPEGGLFMRVTFTPPVAGINRIGDTKGGSQDYNWAYTEYFTSAAFFGYRAFPWAGVSIGYTLKGCCPHQSCKDQGQ